jgi:polar amino acid transport system substrate-binding protein
LAVGYRKPSFVLALMLALFSGTLAQAQEPAATAPKKLTVVTRILPPFVVKEGTGYSGFSIELWQAIAAEMKTDYAYLEAGNVKEILGAVDANKSDLGIAAISITSEREQKFDFSQPMFESGLQIMTPAQTPSGLSWRHVREFLTTGAIPFLLGLLALMILVPGHIAWLVERRHADPLFARSYFPGIFQAIWWSTGAATGQQPDTPRSVPGRTLAAISILGSVFFLTYFQANLTASLTVKQLQGDIAGPDDLPGKRVGTTTGSTSAAYLETKKVKVVEFQKIEAAIEALENKQLDAVVFDAPVLLYHAANEGRGKVEMVGPIFRREDYGILMPQGSPLRKPVNAALLKLRENGTYEILYKKWFSAEGS